MLSEKTKAFIAKARKVHGDKYDYSLVNYTRAKDKITINCRTHGAFDQRACNHLEGRGCRRCMALNSLAINNSDAPMLFFAKAKDVHGDLYIYDKSRYAGAHRKITIGCKVHGYFEQRANTHLRGGGCPECGRERTLSAWQGKAARSFVSRAREVHGEKYDYSQSHYVKAKRKVKIICKMHGLFEQTPDGHLHGSGCPSCGGVASCKERHERAVSDFIDRAVSVHGDKYDYSNTKYINSSVKIQVICRKHGAFTQSPHNHLSGNGCPLCLWDRDQKTCLYIMQTTGMVKVGISIEPERRLRQQNNSQTFTSALAKVWELPNFSEAYRLERLVHESLNKFNANLSGFDGATEWFMVTVDEAIAAVTMVMSELS